MTHPTEIAFAVWTDARGRVHLRSRDSRFPEHVHLSPRPNSAAEAELRRVALEAEHALPTVRRAAGLDWARVAYDAPHVVLVGDRTAVAEGVELLLTSVRDGSPRVEVTRLSGGGAPPAELDRRAEAVADELGEAYSRMERDGVRLVRSISRVILLEVSAWTRESEVEAAWRVAERGRAAGWRVLTTAASTRVIETTIRQNAETVLAVGETVTADAAAYELRLPREAARAVLRPTDRWLYRLGENEVGVGW